MKALSQIVSLSRASGSVRFETLRSVPMGEIHDLVQHGLVTADEDEFGSLVLTVVRQKIEPNVMQNLGDPIHAIRNLSDQNLLKCSKIEVLGRLREQGWQHAENTGDGYEAGSPKVFQFIWSRPLSYFVALHSHLTIFAKGVRSIMHNGADSYYRCLLSLRADKLSVVLREGSEMSNEFYANALKDEGDFDDGRGLCPVPSHVNMDEQPLDMLVDMPPLLPPAASCAEWARCVVKGPDGLSHKIWFDNCSHGSGHKRAWVNCSKHGCIKYVPIFGGYRSFCGAMHMWWRRQHELPEISKAEHLDSWPCQEDIDNASSTIELSPF